MAHASQPISIKFLLELWQHGLWSKIKVTLVIISGILKRDIHINFSNMKMYPIILPRRHEIF